MIYCFKSLVWLAQTSSPSSLFFPTLWSPRWTWCDYMNTILRALSHISDKPREQQTVALEQRSCLIFTGSACASMWKCLLYFFSFHPRCVFFPVVLIKRISRMMFWSLPSCSWSCFNHREADFTCHIHLKLKCWSFYTLYFEHKCKVIKPSNSSPDYFWWLKLQENSVVLFSGTKQQQVTQHR